MTTVTVADVRVIDDFDDSAREIHTLFQETLGASNVEDIHSFRETVSPLVDDAVLPSLVSAYEDGGLIGAMLGLYLRKLNAGMILYAGVKEPFHGRGEYVRMRNVLLSSLVARSTSGLDFVLSEIDEDDWLVQKYLIDWAAFTAPCDYVQPAVQGLPRRKLKLLVMPVAKNRAEIAGNLPTIIREVFRGVYRIAEPDSNPDFRHAVESLRK